MSTNRCPEILGHVNSCLVGTNSYRIVSDKEEFYASRLEELVDPTRQSDGRCYLRAHFPGEQNELWMVPFSISEARMQLLQQTVEYVMENYLGRGNLLFPFDIVSDDNNTAFMIRPIDRNSSTPVRKYLPDSYAERWKIAISLFTRVKELSEMGLTSNGISREQVRVRNDSPEVVLWLNETLSILSGSEYRDVISRHEGFMTIPVLTEKACSEHNLIMNGRMRDVYSAAIIAFYLIMYTHPFIGISYYGLLREDYLTRYLYNPEYIMDPKTQNNPGNQVLSDLVNHQWEKTVPELRNLFNSIFMAVCDPVENWDVDDPCWDPNCWIEALTRDAEENDNSSSRTDFRFEDERYHQV